MVVALPEDRIGLIDGAGALLDVGTGEKGVRGVQSAPDRGVVLVVGADDALFRSARRLERRLVPAGGEADVVGSLEDPWPLVWEKAQLIFFAKSPRSDLQPISHVSCPVLRQASYCSSSLGEQMNTIR